MSLLDISVSFVVLEGEFLKLQRVQNIVVGSDLMSLVEVDAQLEE